ncbi:hypothetical protein ACVIIW_004916 [Bradyrhizobium sp. USDA 4449]
MTYPLIAAPCSNCVGFKNHSVLFQKSTSDGGEECTFRMIECCGCGRISMSLRSDVYFANEDPITDYFPSPVFRREPDWVRLAIIECLPIERQDIEQLMSLLKEVYQAVAGGQYRLAAMGIRALLEQVMIMKVGDLSTFNEKLDAFQHAGYISAIQRKAMRTTLDVGDAAMHRGFVPSEHDLNVALDIVEGVMAPIYGHANDAQRLASRVPPRQ